jgi:hypothetical protein
MAYQAHDHDTLDTGFLETGAGVIHVGLIEAYQRICSDSARTADRELVSQIDLGIAPPLLIAVDNQRRDTLAYWIDALRVGRLPG